MRWLLLVVMSGCLLEVDNEPPPLPSDLEGTYEVSDWVAQEPDCSGPPVEVVSPYAVFEVALEEVYGVDALVLRPCTGPGNCDGGLATEVVFFETWDDEKATGTLRTAEQAAGTCTLTWVEATLIGTASGVELSTRTDQEQTTGVDLQDCLNQQDAWSGDRTCVRLDVVTGVRL